MKQKLFITNYQTNKVTNTGLQLTHAMCKNAYRETVMA